MDHKPSDARTNLVIACFIGLASSFIFWLSPVHQLTDSHYSLLVTESLLRNRSFALETYNIPRLTPQYHDHTWKNGHIHQLEVVGNHYYYYMPPGSSVLSLPFVAVLNRFGLSASNADGSYNPQGEVALERIIAALLMATAAAIFFLTSRLLLTTTWSLVITFAAAFGTQIWSTSSRALWADTWGIVLTSGVVYLLLAHELKIRQLNPVVLATLLSWMYFVRPTNAIIIATITIYLLLWHRSLFLPYALTGALWLIGFLSYSWIHYHHLLPTYFRVNRRLRVQNLLTAIVGNLVSPSRGLFIYVPILLFLSYVLFRNRAFVRPRRLVWISLLISIFFLLVVSAFDPWWGGASFGPRYLAPLVPWFVLLAILGFKAMLEAPRPVSSSLIFAGMFLLAASITVHAIGAFSKTAWKWNATGDLDHNPRKVWDIRYPQLLSPFITSPLPKDFPPIKEYILLSETESERYLPYGWSGAEPGFRWTDGTKASIIFAISEPSELLFVINAAPFVVPEKLEVQRVEVILNDRPIRKMELREGKEETVEFLLPVDALGERNILTLHLPDATSPSRFMQTADERQLALAVRWIGFKSKPTNR